MFKVARLRRALRIAALAALTAFTAGCAFGVGGANGANGATGASANGENGVRGANDAAKPQIAITRLEFNVPLEALEKALALDVQSHTQVKPKQIPMDWVELLAYIAASNGNDFNNFNVSELDALAQSVQSGKKIRALAADLPDYDYYHAAFSAVLGGYVGEYEVEVRDDGSAPKNGITNGITNDITNDISNNTNYSMTNDAGNSAANDNKTSDNSISNVNVASNKDGIRVVTKYGLKAYSPIAGNHAYSDGDDFHVTRAEGSRGHDLFGETGTPLAAVEAGTVETLGWGRYGGWRVGIRSLDKKRYYEYEHLRKNQPFHTSLKKGDAVRAGDIIGYLGKTGYTTQATAAAQDHLYFSMRIDYDEAAQKSNNGIWIDPFAITRLLNRNRSNITQNGTYNDEKDDANDDINNSNTKDGTPIDVHHATQASVGAEDPRPSVKLPIVIYHFVLDKKVSKGEIFITPNGLREDLDYIIKQGYTTVTVADLVDYVYNGAKLPEKPILLSFDDGFYNNIHYAEPLLKERGMRAVLAVVGEFSQASTDTGDVNVRYSYVTWEQIKQADANGVFEIQNHTWALHRLSGVQGVRRKKGEPVVTYCTRLENDLTKLSDKLEEVTGKRPTAFAYPFGAFSECTPEALLDIGFLATMTSTEGLNTLVRGDPNSLIQLCRYTRKSGEGAAAFFGRMVE